MDEELRGRYRRDFTREPIKQRPEPRQPVAPSKPDSQKQTSPTHIASSPISPIKPLVEEDGVARKAHKVKRKKRSKLKLLFLVLLLAVLGAAGGLGFRKWQASHVKPTSPTIVTKSPSKMQLYSPVNLPADYHLNNDVKSSANLVTYSVTYKSADKFVLSIQPLASSFDYETFKKKFLTPDEFTTNIGNALAGKAGSSLIGIVRTNDNVLIIINALNTDTQPQLEIIIRSLQKSN